MRAGRPEKKSIRQLGMLRGTKDPKRRGGRMGDVLEKVTRFGSYIIRNVSNGGLQSALQGIAQANLDLWVFQDTKVTNIYHIQDSVGHCVLVSDTPIQHHWDIVVLYCKAEHFQVEAHNIHGSNVTSFNMESGERRWFVVGCYFPPQTAPQLQRVSNFPLASHPKGLHCWYPETSTMTWLYQRGKPKRNISWQNWHQPAQMTCQRTSSHATKWALDGRAWCMLRMVWGVQYWKDYLLGTYLRLSQNVPVWDPHNNLYHRMVLGCLYGATQRQHYH